MSSSDGEMSGAKLKRIFDEAIARMNAMSREEFLAALRERCPELLEGRGPMPFDAVVPERVRRREERAARARAAAKKRAKRARAARKPAAKGGRRRR